MYFPSSVLVWLVRLWGIADRGYVQRTVAINIVAYPGLHGNGNDWSLDIVVPIVHAVFEGVLSGFEKSSLFVWADRSRARLP